MGNTRREKRYEINESIRALHAKGLSRLEIQNELQVSGSAVYKALRFVDSDSRPCRYESEPHDVPDHRNCHGRNPYMDYDEPEEFPK